MKRFMIALLLLVSTSAWAEKAGWYIGAGITASNYTSVDDDVFKDVFEDERVRAPLSSFPKAMTTATMTTPAMGSAAGPYHSSTTSDLGWGLLPGGWSRRQHL